ncbi:MAG: nucleotidyltransferase family protein [Microgenomates group bacterium]
MNTYLTEIKNKAIPILKDAGVTRSSVFGSYVRGEQNETSDIDILIDFPKGKSFFAFVDVKLKLEDALGKKVDLVEYDCIKPRLRESILSSHVQIL